MRILIAGQTYSPARNGQAVFSASLAEGLADCGHDVFVVVPAMPEGAGRRNGNALSRNPALLETPSVTLNLLHSDVFFTPAPARTVRRAFDLFQPDIVHIQDHYPISRAVLRLARRRRIPVVATNHFMPENLLPYVPAALRRRRLIYQALWRWALDVLNRADCVTAPSETAKAILRANGLRAPALAISCGVDPRRFAPTPAVDRPYWRRRYGLATDKTIFLFVGRVDGEKRLDVLLQALASLGRDDIQLAIAGEGAARRPLEGMAARLRLGEQVRFLGFVPNDELPALLKSVDIFTMPSEAELLSIATLEAMSCGRPVLAAAARALPELVEPGVNGYLFRPGDAEDAARWMGLLADHPEDWPALGAAGLEKVRPHFLEHTIGCYEALYKLVSRTLSPTDVSPQSVARD